MFEQQIERGMAKLDEVAPGWERLIDINTLNVYTCQLCVLGQVFGDYDAGLLQLWRVRRLSVNPVLHGFTTLPNSLRQRSLDGSDMQAEFNVLTDEWKAAITARRMMREAIDNAAKEPLRELEVVGV